MSKKKEASTMSVKDFHDGSIRSDRGLNALFSGGQLRELVLKEQGMDEIAINYIEVTHSPDRSTSSKDVGAPEQYVSTS